MEDSPSAREVIDAAHRFASRCRAPADVAGCWQIDVPGVAHLQLDISHGRCTVTLGRAESPDAVLTTDADTWIEIADGRLDGVDAFLADRLAVDGDLHRAVKLQARFATPDDAPSARALRTRTSRGVELASLAAGTGSPVLLLHGLAANLLSFLPTLRALASDHEVHALDLPGFGRSDKPLPAGRRYHPAWMAEHVAAYIRERRLGQVHVIGNSMGGRIAAEVGLNHPELVRSVSGLGPAPAFDEFQALRPLLRLAVLPFVGLAPLPMSRGVLDRLLIDLFHDPSAVPAQVLEAAASDTLANLRDRRFRLAVAGCARHLGATPASGRRSFWSRLAELDRPSLWIFGRQDRLVPRRYAESVRRALPHAQVELWDGLGHVPQFEKPDETHTAIRRHLARTDAALAARRQPEPVGQVRPAAE